MAALEDSVRRKVKGQSGPQPDRCVAQDRSQACPVKRSLTSFLIRRTREDVLPRKGRPIDFHIVKERCLRYARVASEWVSPGTKNTKLLYFAWHHSFRASAVGSSMEPFTFLPHFLCAVLSDEPSRGAEHDDNERVTATDYSLLLASRFENAEQAVRQGCELLIPSSPTPRWWHNVSKLDDSSGWRFADRSRAREVPQTPFERLLTSPVTMLATLRTVNYAG